jgi:hypothetical protein
VIWAVFVFDDWMIHVNNLSGVAEWRYDFAEF